MRLLNLILLSLSVVVFMSFTLNQRFSGLSTQTPPTVSAGEIRALQDSENGQDHFVVVDVRSKVETDVSMIPGALTKSEFENTRDQHRGKKIIVYCTVGVRSGHYAATLNRDGWSASNYKGSILDWCGNNFPLVASGQATNRVHTYNRWYTAPSNYVSIN